jgi:hypothetical protein
MDLLDTPRVAVTVALCSRAITVDVEFGVDWIVVAAVARNVALVVPAGTNTDTGTLKTVTGLLKSATMVPPMGAALETVTVQLVDAEAAKLVLSHCSEVIVVGQTTEKDAEAVEAPSVAVTVTP